MIYSFCVGIFVGYIIGFAVGACSNNRFPRG